MKKEELQLILYVAGAMVATVGLMFMLRFVMYGPSAERQATESHIVDDIHFQLNKSTGQTDVYIETASDMSVTPVQRLTFKISDENEPLQRNTYEYDESYWMHDRYFPTYVLLVPKNQRNEISKAYADAYAETLNWSE